MNSNGEYNTNGTNEKHNKAAHKELDIPPCLENTIIGNVLIGYKNKTGCIIKPNRSFEIDSNTYLLLGSVTKLPDTPKMIKREDISENLDLIELAEPHKNDKKKYNDVCKEIEDITRKIKRIINMS